MAIVDTHIHIWNFAKAEYPWLKNNTTFLNRTYSIDELDIERKLAGVTNGILVQAANNTEDTNWMLEVAEKTEWISGVVGWLPLMQPDKIEKEIVVNKTNSYFKGVRHLIHEEPNSHWLLQPQVLESLQLLAENNLTYDVVGILPSHLEVAIKVAEKLPRLKLMLDHLNQPPHTNTTKWNNWCGLMKAAAQHPNIYTKISGLGTAVNKKNWSVDDIKPSIDFILGEFGSQHSCLGGDWPVSLQAGAYSYTWAQYKKALTTLNEIESLENVFFTTAKQFYNL